MKISEDRVLEFGREMGKEKAVCYLDHFDKHPTCPTCSYREFCEKLDKQVKEYEEDLAKEEG